MRRILITGGLGFLGRHLSRRLLETDADCRLTIVDNLSSPGAEPPAAQERTTILIADFREFDASSEFDEVYHLASPVGSVGILGKQASLAQQIVDLSVRACEIALASGAALLHVSSSEVYGSAGVNTEVKGKIGARTPGARAEYARGKIAAENVLLESARRTKLRLTICRPFNVIGEWQSAQLGFVVPTFFERALSGDNIPVFYDGKQRRAFCDVRDAVEGMIAVQRRGRPLSTYNIGCPKNIVQVRHLAEKIKRLCASRSLVRFVDPRTLHGDGYTEGFEKLPDITRIRKHVSWEPQCSLRESLERIHRHHVSGE